MSEAFNTLDAARHLKDAGMEHPHAEAVADVVDDSRDGLATKADITILSERMEALRRELATHRWILGLIASMCMATLAGVVVIALQL